MTTRTYYLPKNRIALHIVNNIVAKVGCSIGDIRVIKDTLKVSITCNQHDIPKVEKILWLWNMIEK